MQLSMLDFFWERNSVFLLFKVESQGQVNDAIAEYQGALEMAKKLGASDLLNGIQQKLDALL